MANDLIIPQGIAADYRPHPITTDGRCTIVMEPGRTLEESMRHHLPTGIDAVASVNGVLYTRAAWDKIVLRDGDVVNVRAVVHGGDGGSNPIAAVLAIAVLVAAPYIASYILHGAVTKAALAATSASITGKILTAAIGVGGILVINALFPPRLPNFPSQQGVGQASPQYSLSGGGNRARPYEPILLLLGTHRMFPDVVNSEYTEFDEEGEQFLNQIFDFGIGNLSYGPLRIGDTELTNFDAVETQQGVSRVTLVHGNVDTIPGGDLEHNVPLLRTTANNTTAIAFDIVSQSFRANDEGKIDGGSASFRLEYIANGTSGLWTSRVITIGTPSGSEARNPVRRSYKFTVPSASYDLRVTLLTQHDSEDERTTFRQSVHSFRAFQDTQADFTGRNPLALRIKATGQLYGRVQSINADVSQLIPSWNGTEWIDDQVTSNPGDILRQYYKGWFIGDRLIAGMGLPDDRIDLPSIQGFAEFCRENNLECNIVIQDKRDHSEMLKLICQCGWGVVDGQSGKWGVLWEDQGRPMTAIITPSNVISGSVGVTYDNEGLADELIGNFIDRTSDYDVNNIRRLVPDILEPERVITPRMTVEVDLDGITDGEHAAKEMNRAVAAQAYHIRTITWDMDIDEAIGISRGDVVGATHGLIGSGNGGRLMAIERGETNQPTSLILSKSVEETGTIWISDFDSVVSEYQFTRDQNDEHRVTLDRNLPIPYFVDNVIEDPHSYRFMAFSNKSDMVKLRITGKEPNGTNIIQFTARDEVDEYYAHRNGDLRWNPLDGAPATHLIPVSSFSVSQDNFGTRIFSWWPHQDQDVVAYRIRYADNASNDALSWDTMKDLHEGLLMNSPYTNPDFPDPGTYRFGIVGVLRDGRRTIPRFLVQEIREAGLNIANATWFFGTIDPDNSLGIDGNLYLNTATNRIFRKTEGVWVFQTDLSGADGATWHTGSGTPSNTLGVDGDYYFDRLTAQIYLKSRGAWEFQIDIDGTDGSTWFSGAGAPTSNLGVVGDFYFRNDNGFIYRKITTLQWRFERDITGAQGEDGNGVEYIYIATATEETPSAPSNAWLYDQPELPWLDDAPNVTSDLPFLWRADRLAPGSPELGDEITFPWGDPHIISHYGRDGAAAPRQWRLLDDGGSNERIGSGVFVSLGDDDLDNYSSLFFVCNASSGGRRFFYSGELEVAKIDRSNGNTSTLSFIRDIGVTLSYNDTTKTVKIAESSNRELFWGQLWGIRI